MHPRSGRKRQSKSLCLLVSSIIPITDLYHYQYIDSGIQPKPYRERRRHKASQLAQELVGGNLWSGTALRISDTVCSDHPSALVDPVPTCHLSLIHEGTKVLYRVTAPNSGECCARLLFAPNHLHPSGTLFIKCSQASIDRGRPSIRNSWPSSVCEQPAMIDIACGMRNLKAENLTTTITQSKRTIDRVDLALFIDTMLS